MLLNYRNINVLKIYSFIKSLIYSVFLGVLQISSVKTPAIAQIVPDRTLPNNSQVMQNGDDIVIEGGTALGQNLFHSFQEFSTATGTEAYFNNPVTIDNIITRITGGNISNIDGLIRANGSANLFLINPNGLFLGPNARLDIGGSFFASTAEAIIFDNRQIFSATDPENSSLLTVNVPIGLQFGETPGQIQVQGAENGIVYNDNFKPLFGDRPVGIEVSPNSTLGLIGGRINFQGGNITTRGGRIELGSVAGNSTVTLVPVNNGWAVDYTDVENFQIIQLSQGASVDASGARAGDIQIQGQSLLLYDGSVVASNPLGDIDSGDISIKTVDYVIVSGVNSLDFPSSILNEVDVGASSDGGFLAIDTGRLLLENGGVISVATFGAGDSGELLINARESVEMKGRRLGEIPTFLLSEANTEATGNSNPMIINTKRLIVQDGGFISAAILNSVGEAGDIIINASESVEISGTSRSFDSGITIFGSANATGNAGNILINTNQLIIKNEGEIGGVNAGMGEGGSVTINANSIFLENGGSITANTEFGNGGNINLNVSDGLLLRNQSLISTEAGGTGNGGNIALNADTIVALENSDIIANAFQGSGGQIQVNTQGIFGTEFREALTPESDITASSRFGLSGTVIINNPAVNPTSGLLTLSDEVTDPTAKVNVGCAATEGNSFTIVGRGGIPEDPTHRIQGQTIWRDLRDFSQLSEDRENISDSMGDRSLNLTPTEPTIEANDWLIQPDGTLELVAVMPGNFYQNSGSKLPQCQEVRSYLDRD